MKIYARKQISTKTNKPYYVLVAEGDGERIYISFDINVIIRILPLGIDYRTLDEKGIEVGELTI